MSYATSLRLAYPPPYGPSTLLSDDLVRQSSFTSYYYSALPYSNTNYLLPSNSFRYDYPTSYRTPSYTNWQRTRPPAHVSSSSINNIREYSESLGTTSNTNTASSLARSIDETNATNHRRHSQIQIESSPPQVHEENKPIPATYRSLPELSASKVKPKTPTPTVELERQPTSVDVQAWIDEVPKDNQQAEQAWAEKIDQLHTTRIQREKEKDKAKSTRPLLPKTVNETNIVPKRTNSYFDSLFEGNFVRKTSTNQQHPSPSYQQKYVAKNEPTGTVKPKTTIFQRKIPAYEPPSIKQPITKPPMQKQTNTDSQTPRENIHLDDAERYRQALQKFRLDRAEQYQRENNESTAKRLNYGNYVRQSIREGSLRNSIRPLPWTDFLELKKGNVYSLNKEEKKDLYNQSRSYGERIRYRNFALHHPQETPRIIPFQTVYEETQSIDDKSETPKSDKQPIESEHSSSTIRPTEDDDADASDSHQTSRTNSSTN